MQGHCLTLGQPDFRISSNTFNHLYVFLKTKFFQQHELGFVSRDLVVAMLAVSAKILRQTRLWSNPGLDICLEYLLTLKAVNEESPSKWHPCIISN